VSGTSGAVYLGANLEFAGLPLSSAVHAEQAAVGNLIGHGEAGMVALGVNAPPCGHCRQFLLELGDPAALQIELPGGESVTLAALLPRPFGPRELGVAAQPFRTEGSAAGLPVSLTAPLDAVARQAAAAAHHSHAPYSGTRCGAALELDDGTVVAGRVFESVAYNPTLPALPAALSSLLLAGHRPERVRRAVLFVLGDEPDGFHGAAREALAASCPGVGLQVFTAMLGGA
jgi:cytidine deaminase